MEANLLFFDFETTSSNANVTKPVSVAASLVRYDGAKRVEGARIDYRSFVACDVEIEPEAKAVHRIEEVDLKDALPLHKQAEFLQLFEYADYIVGHNIRKFDCKILLREMPDHPYIKSLILEAKWIDTLVLAKKTYQTFPSHSLQNLFYRIPLVESPEERKKVNFHDAAEDVEVSVKLFDALMKDNKFKDANEAHESTLTVEPLTIMPIGNDKGLDLSELAIINSSSLKWYLRQPWLLMERPELYLGIIQAIAPANYPNALKDVKEVMKKLPE